MSKRKKLSASSRARYFSDRPLLKVRDFLLQKAGNSEALESQVAQILRNTFDLVIDGRTTRRFSIDELEKTEKTYIGTRFENNLRAFLNVERGKFDLLINEINVDVKFSLEGGWMIPKEVFGELCLLASGNDHKGTFDLGLVRVTEEILTSGQNRDQKKQISAAGKEKILWLVRDGKLPENFLGSLPKEKVLTILDPEVSGQQRIDRLFSLFPNKRISRLVIEIVGQQKDPLRRIRRNGGARTPLWERGIAILSGQYDRDLLKLIGRDDISNDEFISVYIKDLDEELRQVFQNLYLKTL